MRASGMNVSGINGYFGIYRNTIGGFDCLRSMFDCSLIRCEDNTDGKVATYIPQLARFQFCCTVSEMKKQTEYNER